MHRLVYIKIHIFQFKNTYAQQLQFDGNQCFLQFLLEKLGDNLAFYLASRSLLCDAQVMGQVYCVYLYICLYI